MYIILPQLFLSIVLPIQNQVIAILCTSMVQYLWCRTQLQTILLVLHLDSGGALNIGMIQRQPEGFSILDLDSSFTVI